MARGATWDPALEERVGEAIGAEIRAQGGNFFGGVCINLLRHPAWGRAQETYGEEPAAARRDGRGAGPRGAAARDGLRQALRLQQHGERPVQRRRRRSTSARCTRSTCRTSAPSCEAGVAERDERLQLGQRRVVRAEPRRCSPRSCATSGASTASSCPTSSGDCATRSARWRPGWTSRCRSRSSGPGRCRPRSPRARRPGTTSSGPRGGSCAPSCRFAARSRTRLRPARTWSPRPSTARWPARSPARSMVLLRNEPVDGRPVLPLDGGRRCRRLAVRRPAGRRPQHRRPRLVRRPGAFGGHPAGRPAGGAARRRDHHARRPTTPSGGRSRRGGRRRGRRRRLHRRGRGRVRRVVRSGARRALPAVGRPGRARRARSGLGRRTAGRRRRPRLAAAASRRTRR